MKNLENFGVQELSLQESRGVNGGCWGVNWSYWLRLGAYGSTIGLAMYECC